jgi:hypothetical protein
MLQGGGVEGAGSLLTTPVGQGGATPIFLNSSRSSKRHSGHFPDLGTRTFAHSVPGVVDPAFQVNLDQDTDPGF